jgi:hypothetical protein
MIYMDSILCKTSLLSSYNCYKYIAIIFQVQNSNLESYSDGSTYMWNDKGFYSHANKAIVYWGPIWQGFCTGHINPLDDKHLIVHCTNGKSLADYEPCCRYNYRLKETI